MMNQRELDVLNILWKDREPMTATNIVEADITKSLTQSTVITVLRRLVKDELVEVMGVARSGKVLSRTYSPTEKSREAVLNNFVDMYKMVKNVVTLDELAARLRE